VSCGRADLVYCILGGCFEVGRLVAGQAAVRSGQGQEPLDEGLGLAEGLPDPDGEHLKLSGRPDGLGHGDVDQGAC
jgi:hypothetical protein